MAETKAGEGPALISFQNDTKFIMSLWLGQASFIAIPSGSTVGPEVTASASIEKDTSTGQHKNDACVVFPIKKHVGPAKLEPGFSYSMSIALDEALGFVGELTQGPMVPFVALRAEVFDRTSDWFKPSRLALDLEGFREAQPMRFTTYDEGRTTYRLAGSGQVTALISFVAGSGERYVGSEAVTVGGAPGYTVVVDDTPVDRAAAVVPLNKASE